VLIGLNLGEGSGENVGRVGKTVGGTVVGGDCVVVGIGGRVVVVGKVVVVGTGGSVVVVVVGKMVIVGIGGSVVVVDGTGGTPQVGLMMSVSFPLIVN
jgi:hypothetical protein